MSVIAQWHASTTEPGGMPYYTERRIGPEESIRFVGYQFAFIRYLLDVLALPVTNAFSECTVSGTAAAFIRLTSTRHTTTLPAHDGYVLPIQSMASYQVRFLHCTCHVSQETDANVPRIYTRASI